MTKIEGQSKVNELKAAIDKQYRIDQLVNENADGVYNNKPADNLSAFADSLKTAGLYLTRKGVVIDAEDFAAFRAAFNAAVQAAGSRPDVPAIEKKVGISRQDLIEAKAIFA
jgi:hypothetical protein